MFENLEVALDDLPLGPLVGAVLTITGGRAGAREVRRMLVERLVIVLVAGAATLVPGLISGGAFDPPVPLWVFVILFAIPFLTWPFVAVPRRGYVVRDRDIVFRQGVLFRSVTAVPFNRIQHVETSSTPLDRKFGIAALQLYTAGGSGGDLKIHGLDAGTAEQLRGFILEKAGSSIENA